MRSWSLNTFEIGLLISVLLTPFTMLRLGVLGVGELGVMLLFLVGLSSGYISNLSVGLRFSRFWFIFIIVSFLGLTYNFLFPISKTPPNEVIFFDLTAYLFIFLTSVTIENLYQSGKLNFYNLLKHVYLFSGILFFILFLLNRVTDSIAGLPLNYYGRFSPLANNLHHVAMFLAPMTFVGLLVLENEKRRGIRLLTFLLILLFSFLTFQTGSFKAIAGLLLGMALYFGVMAVKRLKPSYRKPVSVLIFVSLIIIALLNLEFINDMLWGLFRAEDLQEGRSSLYQKGIEVSLKSPIIGLGPGAHIYQNGQFWDSHQTLLTVFLQSGIVGLFLILKLGYDIARSLVGTMALVAGSIPILTYAMGGDIMRRLPVWLLLLFFYYCTKQLQSNPETVESSALKINQETSEV
ncbi:hypothetical protein J1N09_11100 [Aureitalea sp. L0-47]|uniref:O-antigen ligase family protein n=1 Tax=Aureitalea sp. L0-47 TaxID=2816962 RepID=UPI002237A11C|nr:O-antigen ligase family protein [Aureitalea sp. L0-47]MCW5520390.1 hypothetical protein [Aureitalea sp. L0-47]